MRRFHDSLPAVSAEIETLSFLARLKGAQYADPGFRASKGAERALVAKARAEAARMSLENMLWNLEWDVSKVVRVRSVGWMSGEKEKEVRRNGREHLFARLSQLRRTSPCGPLEAMHETLLPDIEAKHNVTFRHRALAKA